MSGEEMLKDRGVQITPSAVDQFFAEHAAGGPSHIVAAMAVKAAGGEDFAVFSTIAKARAWADTLNDDDYRGVVFVPYVVDVPEYGNVPKGKRQ